jgi:peptidoglycan-associated lipoprotein
MTLLRMNNVGMAILVASMLLAFACKPKPPAAPPPAATVTPAPTPPPPAPVITLRAQPATIDRGGSTTLQWEARNAATVTITPGVGDVALTGNRAVTPASSVSYQATATGPGGTATDVARVTVNIPPAPPAAEPPPTRRPDVTTGNIFEKNVNDVFFDYDKADIRPEMISVLQSNANWLKTNANVRFTIEGHCDERGSEEYNLGLGDRRANAVKEYMVSQGIPANRMETVSYGEERPTCREQTEDCFTKNRRAHFMER